MKKRIILAICSLAIACSGIGMSTLSHEEPPVSEMLLAEAAMNEEPEVIIEEEEIEEIEEFVPCQKGCILETGHEGECKMAEDENVEVILKSTSVERDLKVKFVSKSTGKVISGADFKMKVTSPSKVTKEYSDHDNDGIIWVKDIDGGNYTVEMVELDGYVTAKTLKADVKKKIEYKVVEIADEIKNESQINASKEDGAYGGADKDDSTSNTATLKDTVEYVETSKKEETKTTNVQKKDKFGQPMYAEQAKDEFGTPIFAKILKEPESFHQYEGNTCKRCGFTKAPVCTEHVDKNADKKCDNTNCNAAVDETVHKHYDDNKDCACDGCSKNIDHVFENGKCKNCGKEEQVTPPPCEHTTLENGICLVCKQMIDKAQHVTHTDENTDNTCDSCGEAIVQEQTEDEQKVEEQKVEEQKVEDDSPILSFVFRPFRFFRAATVAEVVDKIYYDETSAPVYNTKSAPVYETETVTTYYGWQTLDGLTYYFDKDGDKVTGQQVIQGISYTFNSDGVRSGNIGIDVSKYQTNINWKKVKNAGINFVIIRCGYRGYGSGVLVEDPLYRNHIQGAKAAGLRVGVYFFSQAVNEAEAIEEASMAVNLANKYGIDMPIAIDSEYANAGNGRADKLSKSERTKITRAFCDTVKSAGHTPMVYASKSWFGSHLDVGKLSGYRIWVAHYAEKCGYSGTYHIWQNTSNGKVDGVPGRVDMNISSI